MLGKKILVFLVQMLLYHGVSFFLARSKANKTPVPAFKIQQKGKKISRKVTNKYYPIWGRNLFSVQKPFGSSMIGHRSERFCVFLPIFAGRDGEGNEQKLGEEWGQAKQWSQYFEKKPSLY